MVINIGVRFNGGFLPGIILLTFLPLGNPG